MGRRRLPHEREPFGVSVLEPLRIEAGLIILDYDYEAHERTPYDLSMDRVVILDKADFIGREALRAIAASPPRRLKTLQVEGDELPESGAAVTRDGEPVGTLTSPAISPRFGSIALAILDTAVANDGEWVEVAAGEATVPATVAALSIHDPHKRRPRA